MFWKRTYSPLEAKVSENVFENNWSTDERLKGEGKGKEEDGKGDREIGSEALAETEKFANAQAGNRTRDHSKSG